MIDDAEEDRRARQDHDDGNEPKENYETHSDRLQEFILIAK